MRALRTLARSWPWLLPALTALLVAAEVSAQWTGGSAGGGSFSGGGGGSSDSDYGGGGGGDVGGLFDLVFFLFRVNPTLGFVALILVVLYLVWRARGGRSMGHSDDGSVGSAVPSPTSRAWFQVDITEVRIALEVTVDHTRAAVALEMGIERIPVRVHLPNEPLPPSMASRPWNRAGETAATWGEAVALRAAGQRPPLGPTGTPTPPVLRP